VTPDPGGQAGLPGLAAEELDVVAGNDGLDGVVLLHVATSLVGSGLSSITVWLRPLAADRTAALGSGPAYLTFRAGRLSG
jgi:hypothetical protein